MNLSTLLNRPVRPKARPSQLTRTTKDQTASGRQTSTSVTNSTAPGGGLVEKSTTVYDGNKRNTMRELGDAARDSGRTVYEEFEFTKPGTSNHTQEYVAMNNETGSCYGWKREQEEKVHNRMYEQEECTERFEALQSAFMEAYK